MMVRLIGDATKYIIKIAKSMFEKLRDEFFQNKYIELAKLLVVRFRL